MHAIGKLLASTSVVLVLASTATTPRAQTNVTAWQADGQTWVVWDETPPTPASYWIHASTTDFVPSGSVGVGVPVGRLLPEDWRGGRLQVALPGATYRIPGPGGGTYQLGPNQGVFAYTARDTTPLYFAVVKDGQTAVVAANSTRAIPQTLDPVRAHAQGTRLTPSSGQTLHVFAHWIDGHVDHASGRPDYPVMGNASMNGCAGLFLVTEPTLGLPASDGPAAVALHGGGGLFMNFIGGASPNIGLEFDDALLITPDGTINTVDGPIGSAWLGLWEGFDRFASPLALPVPNGSVVVDYTMRRLLWQLDWVAEHFPVDPRRVSLIGHSGGARGAGTVARVYPERFSAALLFHAPLKTGVSNPVFGDEAQNLTTTLPGAPGVADLASETFFASLTERDLPFTRLVLGRGDTADPWSLHKVQSYHAIDASRMGRHLFWDERGHGPSTWTGAFFNGSSMLRGDSVLGFRSDESYPAFFRDDQDPTTPGRQPDMGNGDPAGGDPHGAFGGYYDWDQASLVDARDRWECTFWLRASSTNPADDFPGQSATVGVGVRRPQAFHPAPDQLVEWRLVRDSTRTLLQRGFTLAEPDGLVAVEGLLVFKDPSRVRLELVAHRLRFSRAAPRSTSRGL